MKRILQWCIELGIECISVYAFSIDNFRRPQDEVDGLMKLAELKFEELINVRCSACSPCHSVPAAVVWLALPLPTCAAFESRQLQAFCIRDGQQSVMACLSCAVTALTAVQRQHSARQGMVLCVMHSPLCIPSTALLCPGSFMLCTVTVGALLLLGHDGFTDTL